ncbi:nuclear distribution protein nudE-like 1 isoform X1 [Cydia strobilella]|uniref:nuclear distribution protein nudE-like 1 isoform X1 n=1 Tax=Cydia strobilella TaxID=1100964 RepID=UPI003007AA8C
MEPPRQSESDTVEHWKKQAKHYEQKAIDMQQELDEYTENSAQLEKELEASLLQVEKQNRDLEHQNQRLKNEIESLKNKLERSQHETNALENEVQSLKIEQDKKAEYIRELEQKNDDLERGQRVVSESVSCIEALLNQAYERNAVLENEVDEIETLKVRLQRATDEARDLKQELKVVEKIPVHRKEDDSTNENAMVNGHNTSSRAVETETQTVLPSPQKREINGNAMTPSARVSAINIVGDLLRKVGLERFLCRECGKIKCSCDSQPPDLSEAAKSTEISHACDNTDNSIDASIEYRNPKVFIRQSSGPDPITHKHQLKQRYSEEGFSRPGVGENGKLRRSFAVRSREGLENLLSFASIRNGQPRAKPKQTLAR